MADLVAQGEKPHERWRRTLPVGEEVVVGRAVSTAWAVPWDPQVSRRHVSLLYRPGLLFLRVLPEARNPVYYRGAEVQEAVLRPNDRFVIGATTFTFLEDIPLVHVLGAELMHREVFRPEHLEAVSFHSSDRRLEVLSRLPEVIARAADMTQLSTSLVSMLLSGIALAELAAVVRLVPDGGAEKAGVFGVSVSGVCSASKQPGDLAGPGPGVSGAISVETIYWDERHARFSDFEPSRRLVREAMAQGQTVLHVWRRPVEPVGPARVVGIGNQDGRTGLTPSGKQLSGDSSLAPRPEFTMQEGVDWAFCTPVKTAAFSGLALYVAGSWPKQVEAVAIPELIQTLKSDMKFAGIVAAIVGALRNLAELERRQSQLRQFLPQSLLERLEGSNWEEVLAPRETFVTVLFCDLRGFSREAERQAENLMGLLQRVGKALGVMSRAILREGGVIGDFHGDAAMGFWGWPLVERPWMGSVCRAALAIQREFEGMIASEHPELGRFQVGIGIASGRAVAGKIGTEDQVKITVFGPVVNLASRLEGLTKLFRVPILVDETSAQAIRKEVPTTVARVRRLARVRPYGIKSSVEIAELRPPASEDPILSDEHIRIYERALDAFIEGRWAVAYPLLRQLPPEDMGADFLIAFIVQHNRQAPPGWDGVIVCQWK